MVLSNWRSPGLTDIKFLLNLYYTDIFCFSICGDKEWPQFQCVKWVNVSFSSSHGRQYSSEVYLDSFWGLSLPSSLISLSFVLWKLCLWWKTGSCSLVGSGCFCPVQLGLMLLQSCTALFWALLLKNMPWTVKNRMPLNWQNSKISVGDVFTVWEGWFFML